MKKKASLIKIAGLNERGQRLYAILDTIGHTEYQVWANAITIQSQYVIV